jgi:diguanylate cyclase (GGDEF)-like protein
VWIATEGGLAKLSQPAFQNYTARDALPVSAVWTAAELPDRRVCLGTNKGLVVIDTTGTPQTLTIADGLPEESIVDMEVGIDGSLWILGFDGVFRWIEGRFISYPYAPFHRIGLHAILPIGSTEVWVATYEDIMVLDPRTGRYRAHPMRDHLNRRPRVKRLAWADAGAVWMLGSELWRWTSEGALEKETLPSTVVPGTISNVRQWGDTLLLTTSDGLVVREGDSWRRVELRDRFPFDGVRASDGSYWLGCSRGIARVHGDSVQAFDAYDGVALIEGNTNAALLASDGRVWLGGRNVTVIRPDLVRLPQDRAPTVVRATVEDRVQWFPEAITCGSRERSLELHLACPSFFNEQAVTFRYRLPGVDAGWREATDARSIRYTNVPPGDLVFETQARQKHGAWSGPVATLPISVLPAWWQTAAARVGFAALLVGLGFLVSLGRVRYLQAQREKLSRVVAEQTHEIRRQRDHLAELATADELTGLPNRRKLSDRLDLELVRASRYGRPASLLIFDVDHFKHINDSRGHAAGDEALKAIARRGVPAIRETDVLARWGGDEFVLLMPETDHVQGLAICSRLKEAIETTARSSDEVSFTISGGMATWSPTDGPTTAAGLLARADSALYHAKEQGRNRICD